MRRSLLISAGIAALTLVAVVSIYAISNRRAKSAEAPTAAATVTPKTPADRLIQSAETLIRRQPDEARGYNQLSAGFMRKARETGDFSFNERAAAALKRSREISPRSEANYDALRMQAALHLTYHRFAEALKLSKEMQQLQPNDHYIYGVMTDALVELGDYPAAVEAADRMVDLRPDATSYARISYLRALHGHTEAAIEAMRLAVRASSPRDAEGHAWLRVQLASELLNAGKRAEAAREAEVALQVFPDYHEALAMKARILMIAGELASAVDYYRRAQERVPLPETVIALGDLYQQLGRADDAKRQYALLDAVERSGGGTYSRHYALFLADQGQRLDEALTIAQRERAARADIYTCDALAWCLFKNGRLAEAGAAMKEALRLGTRDARLYYHAGMIHHGLGDRDNARKYLKLAAGSGSALDPRRADAARRTLAELAE